MLRAQLVPHPEALKVVRHLGAGRSPERQREAQQPRECDQNPHDDSLADVLERTGSGHSAAGAHSLRGSQLGNEISAMRRLRRAAVAAAPRIGGTFVSVARSCDRCVELAPGAALLAPLATRYPAIETLNHRHRPPYVNEFVAGLAESAAAPRQSRSAASSASTCSPGGSRGAWCYRVGLMVTA